MDPEKTGKYIMKLRKEAGLSQQQLADQLNVSRQAVSNWERGKRMPDTGTLMPLAEILHVDVSDLLAGGETTISADKTAEEILALSDEEITKKTSITAIALMAGIWCLSVCCYLIFHSYDVSAAISLCAVGVGSHLLLAKRSAAGDICIQTAVMFEIMCCLCSIGFRHGIFTGYDVIASGDYGELLQLFVKDALVSDLIFVLIGIIGCFLFNRLFRQEKKEGIRIWFRRHHTKTELILCWAAVFIAWLLHWQFPLCGIFAAVVLPFLGAFSIFYLNFML